MGRSSKLNKESKIEIIQECMIENPGAHLRYGFNVMVIRLIQEKHGVKVDKGSMSRMVKEARRRLELNLSYFMSKKEYQLQHQRLLATLNTALKKAEVQGDLAAIANLTEMQRKQLNDLEKLDGLMREVHEHHVIDDAKAKALEEFFDEKAGKKKGKA